MASQVHGLSNDQVNAEIKKMTGFIRQEALEKASEIRSNADSEFNIEKAKLVREGKSGIDGEFSQKFKTAEMSQQITQSTLSNKTRLKVLSAQQELVGEIFEKAREKLKERTKGGKGSEYQKVLKGLILEALFAMNEKKLLVRARKADGELVRKAKEEAVKEYRSVMERDCQVEVDEKNPQPEDCAGGVSIIGGMGKIELNNTLEERLKILQLDSLPAVRNTLFGANENRKFYA